MLNQTESGLRTKAFIKQWRGLTPAIAQQSAQVSGLEAAAKGDVAEALGNLLTFASHQFNVGKNLSDVQIALLASEMLRLYWHWRFDEFSFVLREAVAGRYGTTYDRIDAATVHEWCAKYEADRNAVQADQAEHEARAYKQAEQQAPRSELATHAEFGADYVGVRAQFEALSNEQLLVTGQHYQSLKGADNEFITAVGWEVYCERRATRYRQQMLKQFAAAGITGQTQAEKEAERRDADHALELALARGDWQAAGFAAPPVLEKLDWNGQPITPPVI